MCSTYVEFQTANERGKCLTSIPRVIVAEREFPAGIPLIGVAAGIDATGTQRRAHDALRGHIITFGAFGLCGAEEDGARDQQGPARIDPLQFLERMAEAIRRRSDP